MPAINRVWKSNLSNSIIMANSFFQSLFGLMGKKNLPEGHGLLLSHCQSVHTMFMRFPIDVIFLDKDGKVLHFVENMKPWRVSKHLSRARSVLELPAGTIAATGTKLGDTVKFWKDEG